MPRKLEGRCECRAVAFEVADEFHAAWNCHCTNCRALTGSAFLPCGEIARDKLRVTRGADRLQVIGDPPASQPAHCRTCLALLYWRPSGGDNLRVPYGTLVDAPSLRPTEHRFVAFKAPWYEILDDLPQHDERPRG